MNDVDKLLTSPHLRNLEPYDQFISIGNRFQEKMEQLGYHIQVRREGSRSEELFRNFPLDKQKQLVWNFAASCMALIEGFFS